MTERDTSRPDPVDEASQESFPASDAPAWTSVTGVRYGPLPPAAQAEPAVENNERDGRFELRLPEGLAVLDYGYRNAGRTLELVHTEVPPAVRHHGVATRLVEAAVAFARARHLDVIPRCPFAAAFMRQHPELGSLVHQAGPGRQGSAGKE